MNEGNPGPAKQQQSAQNHEQDEQEVRDHQQFAIAACNMVTQLWPILSRACIIVSSNPFPEQFPKPMMTRFFKISLLLAGLAAFPGLFGNTVEDRTLKFYHTHTGKST